MPAVATGRGADLLPEPAIAHHMGTGGCHIVSLVGAKFTTARWAAERAVNLASRDIGGHHRRSRTAATRLPHAGIADVEGWLVETMRAIGVELDRDVMDHLTGWYGTEASDVVRFGAARNRLDRLDPHSPVLADEIAYAAENADAVRLADAVLRRTALGGAGHPGNEALQRAAAIMAETCRWTEARREEELEATEAKYRL